MIPAISTAAKAGAQHRAARNRAPAFAGVLACAVPTAPALAQTQAQMNAAAASDYRREDAAMSAQWTRTYAAMKRRDAQDNSRGGGFGYAAATLASQRAWLKFRDAQCVIEGGEAAGGSMQPMVRAACLARLTKERTIQLRNLMWNR
ncbi:lysozyme inhibitor LprI family protein [Sphingomonas radiodurans]|uniref:lysozyme inhibitor LprI family protein n=1 Tax=Sphingomonas radiodurans TaxID=2890321 RepID=UPI001E419F6C|nr:lysozyme inhibitor LprI family protein [Sphingomonas radiodurans]WBH17713.1 lysozyme inhibitor LprI family protein [Sphingomonas radiodurans]